MDSGRSLLAEISDRVPVDLREPVDDANDLIAELPRHIEQIAADLFALFERFGMSSHAHEDFVRYGRRLQDRSVMSHAGSTLVSPAEDAGSANNVTETQPFFTGPTGLGTSAARLGQPSRSDSLDQPPADHDHTEHSLQDVDFGCPWPLRVSPYLDQARNHALDWMEEFGLAQDRQANAEQFRDWKLGEAAAYFFPEATPEGLDLAADLMGWYFAPFDDQFDGELGQDPGRAAEICGHLIAILDLPEGAPLPASYPVAAGFADLWWRSCRGMSGAWRQRAAHHWKKYLTGQLAEVVNRCHDRTMDAVSCLRQRIATTSSDVLNDLMERVTGFEVPDLAWHTPLLSELRQLTSEIVSITNDLVSADKEAARGDTDNNLLLILETQEHCSRSEAIERMREMTHERFARFLRLEKQVPDLDDVLTPHGSIALHRYVSGLHDIMAGDNEWEHTSGRYRVAKQSTAP